MSDLPATIHFISKAPHFNSIRFGNTVLFSQITVLCSLREIAIFQIMYCIFNASCTQIYCKNRLYIRFFCPFHKFVCPKFIRFNRFPRKIQFTRSFLFWSYPVFPMIRRNKISTWITYCCYMHLLHLFQHVFTKSILICAFMIWFIYPCINNSSHVFQKRTIKSGIYFAYRKFFITYYFCVFHMK